MKKRHGLNGRYAEPADCPKEYGEVISTCWKLDPSKRPTAVQVIDGLQSGLSQVGLFGGSTRSDESISSSDRVVALTEANETEVNTLALSAAIGEDIRASTILR